MNIYPEYKTAMLIEDFDKRDLDSQVKDLGFTPTIYSPAYALLNDSLIERCHQLKMKVIPWTVNDKDLYRPTQVDGRRRNLLPIILIYLNNNKSNLHP
jgi:glycerophosphoryl diester phosphodiesterase